MALPSTSYSKSFIFTISSSSSESYSSRISPTSSSRRSSKVIRPATSPYSLRTIAIGMEFRRISSNKSEVFFCSYVKYAFLRKSLILNVFASSKRSKSFMLIIPTIWLGSPEYTGILVNIRSLNTSMSSSLVISMLTIVISIRGIITSFAIASEKSNRLWI